MFSFRPLRNSACAWITQRLRALPIAQTALLAIGSALFLTVLVPCQTFIANQPLFGFSTQSALLALLPWFAGASLALFALLLAGELLLGSLARTLLLALLLCAYFESGLFSIGLPPLDGEIRAFSNPFRVIIDTALLTTVFLGTLACHRWVKRFSTIIASTVVVMAIAALFDAAPKSATAEDTTFTSGYCPQLDVVQSATFSAQRNILLLILDSTPASLVAETLRAHPELESHFPGFTAYENNLAMHEQTARGLPGLMTGLSLRKDQTANDYSTSIIGPKSFLVPYIQADNAVYFSDQLLSYGYTNRRTSTAATVRPVDDPETSVLFRPSTSIPYISLADTVRFRLAPYRYKGRILARAYAKATKHLPPGAWVYSERQLYPFLANCPIKQDESLSLLIFHTSGIHGPILYDHSGEKLPSPSQALADYRQYSLFVLHQVAALMDALRARGLYDNTEIVIAADHGLITMRETEGFQGHGAESSILWTKPLNASAPFTRTATPTSNCRLHALFTALQQRPLTQQEMTALLEAHDRRFSAKYGARWWSGGRALYFYEWRYDDAGRVTTCENLGIFTAN